MGGDSKKRPETIANTVHDPSVLEPAGWTNAEVIWEQVQEAAAECERSGDALEAGELWRGALDLAREHLPHGDLRVATSLANVAVAARWAGDVEVGGASGSRRRSGSGARERNGSSLSRPSPGREAPRFICASSPATRARTTASPGNAIGSSLEEGRAVLVARCDDRPDESDRLVRWRRERPPGFTDLRRLLGAVLLVAAGHRTGRVPPRLLSPGMTPGCGCSVNGRCRERTECPGGPQRGTSMHAVRAPGAVDGEPGLPGVHERLHRVVQGLPPCGVVDGGLGAGDR